jgi:hypothetical protein
VLDNLWRVDGRECLLSSNYEWISLFMHPIIKSHLMTLVNLTFDLLEHLHQRSVCEPALEILDEVHQSNPVSEFTGRPMGP